MEVDTGEMCNRFESLYTGAITDSLDELGYGSQTLPPEINPLSHEMRMAGIAFPVWGEPDPDADVDANIRRFLRMLGDAPAHSIIAYETQDRENAHLGELSTAVLAKRGCRGAVLDGGTRDIRYILEQDFPVFTRYRTPKDAPPRWRLKEWGVAITIGGVEIRPGDILIGDADGVVCVPRIVAQEVLEMAEETVNTESDVRTAISEGMDPIKAYDQFGAF